MAYKSDAANTLFTALARQTTWPTTWVWERERADMQAPQELWGTGCA